MTDKYGTNVDRRLRRRLLWVLPIAAALVVAVLGLPAPRMQVAEAEGHAGVSGPPGGAVVANSPASDVDTQCSEPGPPITEKKGQRGTCLMHPVALRVAKIFDDPTLQPPDPLIGAMHSHLLPEASALPAWWNLRGVAIYDRSIWPDRDGNCQAGPPHCVTSMAAMRAAQKTGQASIDVPSNLYWYMTVHPEER